MNAKAVSSAYRPGINRYALRKHGGRILFMLPAFVLFAYIVLIPFFQGIPYSFTNWKSIISDDYAFVGFKNFQILLTNKYFLADFVNTLEFTGLYIVCANALGLALALLLWRASRFNNFVRTVVFMPFTVALTSGALVWSYVFTDVYTPLTGLVSPLGNSAQVIPGLVTIATWRDMGYCMLIYIAALQSIPVEYEEAACVEGAGYWRRLWSITLPLIVPAFTSNITLLLAWGLKCFDYPMTVARNMQAAETTAMYVYNNIFGYSKAGLGQAAAILVTLLLVILTAVITSILRKREVEA
ncbi:MAG: sugar ABC transporter permease [Candidatus Limiplasma sp.]|nr:sugar ABC transporter permease [Candidatus Limiplasma sp.]